MKSKKVKPVQRVKQATKEKQAKKEMKMGMKVEREHGKVNPKTNVTNNDPVKTRKIAQAHINEIPDYYDRLKVMEDRAKKSMSKKKAKNEKSKK